MLLTNQAFVFPDVSLPPTRPGETPKEKITYPGVSAAARVTPYYPPRAVSTKEQLKVSLSHYQILTDYPSDPLASPQDVTWQASGPMSPVLTAVDGSAVDSRSRYTFIAGVLLAIAASAFIAALQELRIAMTNTETKAASRTTVDESHLSTDQPESHPHSG
jgi:hypothetical protein